MKQRATCIFATLLCASLLFAQATSGTPGKIKTASGKKATKSKMYRKGSKTGSTPVPVGDAKVPQATLENKTGSQTPAPIGDAQVPQATPGNKTGLTSQPDPGVTVTLNPQPLPPKVVPNANKTNHNTNIKTKGKKSSGGTTTQPPK